MKITCDKCNALYEVDEGRIPPEGLTMKCPRCLASFGVRRPGTAPAAPAAGAASSGTRYYLRRRTGKVFGPFLERAIASMLEQHKLDGDEDVSLDGQSWQSLSQVPALASFVRGRASATSAPSSEYAAATSGGDFDDLADLPAPKGSYPDLADLPAPKGSNDLADLPAPKGGRPARSPAKASRGLDLKGFDQSPGLEDLGEFDLGGSGPEPEPAARSRPRNRGSALDELADLPAPKRASTPPMASRAPKPSPPVRATGLEYGQIELGPDSESEDLSDLPAPKELAEPYTGESPFGESPYADLPAPRGRPGLPGSREVPDLLQPKPGQAGDRPSGLGIVDLPQPKSGLAYGQVDLGGDELGEEGAELDEPPVVAGKPAGVAFDETFELPGRQARAGAPFDVAAPKAPSSEADTDEPAQVVNAPPPRESPQIARAPQGGMPEPAKDREPIAAIDTDKAQLGTPRRSRRIKPLWIGVGTGVFLLVLGVCLGLLTDLGFFGINLVTGDFAKRQRAKSRIGAAVAALRSDTYQGYSQAADELETAAHALRDQSEPWALHAQAAGALLYRYGPSPNRRTQLDLALAKLAKLDDRSPETEKAKALALLVGKQAPAAVAALKKLSDQEAGDAMAALYLGWAELAVKDAKAAPAAFARALAAKPQLAGALFGTAEAHCALGDAKTCEAWIDKTLAAAPSHAGALLRKARLLVAAGKAAEAKPLLDKVMPQQAGPSELSTARTLLAEQAVAAGLVNDARRLLAEAMRIDQRNALAHVVMGRLYYEARQYSEAQRLFRTARNLDPSDIQAAAMLAHTDIALGRPKDADAVVQELLKTSPQAPEVSYLQGLVDETMGKLDSAIKFYNGLIERVPNHFDAYYHLAKIFLRQDKPDDALAVLQQAEAKIPASAKVRAAQGEVLYASKKLDRARLRLEDALRLEPTNNQATFLLASLLADQNRLEPARDKLLELKKRDKAFPGAAAKLGEVYLQLKQPLTAVAEFDQAVAEENPGASVRLAAARAYIEANKLEKSLEQCAKVVESDVSYAAAARALMGEARFKQNKLDDALVEVKQSLEREKKASTFVLLGRIHEARNKNLDALDAYTEALKLESSNLEIRLRRAVLLVKGGTVKDGLKELKAVIVSNPNSAEAYFYMGVALADQGQEARAIESWKTALVKDPKHAQAHFKIALTYLDMQRAAQALPHLEAAVKNGQPSDLWLPDAHYQLGSAAQATGQKKRAIEAFQQYLKIAPAAAALRGDAEKKLKQLGTSSSPE